MISDFNFKLKNVGLINNAEINMSKINVIAGDNSTGNSTSSKILYSFLRSNSKTRKELAKNTLIDEVLDLASEINSFYRFSEFENENGLQKKSELSEIINEIHIKQFEGKPIDIVNYYKKIKNIFLEHTLKYNSTNLFVEPPHRIDDGDSQTNPKKTFIGSFWSFWIIFLLHRSPYDF